MRAPPMDLAEDRPPAPAPRPAPALGRSILKALGRWIPLAVLTLLPVLPLGGAAWALCAAGLPDYALDGDGALIELRVRAATGFAQSVGSYSRLGFEHPGPLHFYCCAPFYALAGGRTAALNLAVAVLGAAALLTALLAAFRAGGLALLAAASLASTVYVGTLGQQLITIWDPAMAILPTLACLLCAAAFGAGRPWAAVPAVLAGSFAVQAHLSLLPPVAAALGAGALWRLRARRADAVPVRSAPALWTALALGILSAAPPLWEQLSGSPGNLTAIARALGGEGPHPTWGAALSITARQASAPWRAILGLGDGGAACWTILAVLMTTTATLVVRGRPRSAAAAVAAVGLAVLTAAPVAVHRIVGEIRPHMLQWIATAGIAAGIAALGGLFERLRETAPRVRLPAGGLLATALAFVAWQGLVRLTVETLVFVGDPAQAAATPALSPVLDRIAAVLRGRDVERVALRVLPADEPRAGHPDFTLGAGLVLGLVKRGFAVAPEPRHAFAYPRSMPRHLAAEALVLVHDERSRAAARAAGPAWDELDLGSFGYRIREP
jgi:hypothetical protein